MFSPIFGSKALYGFYDAPGRGKQQNLFELLGQALAACVVSAAAARSLSGSHEAFGVDRCPPPQDIEGYSDIAKFEHQ